MKSRKFLNIVVITSLVFLLINAVSALDVEVSEKPDEICQCLSSAYKLVLINDELSEKTFYLSADDEEVTIAPTEVTIDGKDSRSILVFLTPACDKEPGDYNFEIQIRDHENQTERVKIDYELNNCRSIKVKVNDIETCVNEPISSQIKVINDGKLKESVILDSSKGELSEKEISLNPDEEETVDFEHEGFDNPGDYTVKIDYKTKDAFISKQDSFKITAKPCSSFEATLTEPQEVCLGESASLLLTIQNTGKIDEEFTIESDDVVITDSKIEIEAGKSKVIKLNVTPEELGEKDIIVTINSKYAGSKKLYSSVKANNCCGVSLISSPTPIEICAGTKAEISVLMSVLNTGLDSEFEIESDSPWLTTELDKVKLAKDEVKQFMARIKPLTKEGDYRSIIRAKNDYCEDKAFITLKVKNCYGLDASLKQDVNEVCSGEKATIPLVIKNTGEVDATYQIKVLNPKGLTSETDSIQLSKGQQGEINLELDTSEMIGKVNLEVVVSDANHPEIKKVVRKEVDVQNCYDFEMSLEDVESCANQNIELTGILTNKGTKDSEYELEYLCPDWIKSKTEKVFLKSGESAKIKLYGEVPLEASGKKSLCSVIVNSKESNESRIYKSNIVIKDKEECFCTKAILNMDRINIEFGKSKIVNVEVENCGEFNQTYSCDVSDNLKEFSYITPEEKFELEPGEKERCYIGFIAKESKEEEIDGKVIISNGILDVEKPITIKVTG